MTASFPMTVHQENVRNGYLKTVTIPSASVLTLHSVGYTLLSAPSNTTYALSPFYVFARATTQTAYASAATMTVGHFTSGPTSLTNTICTFPTGLVTGTTPVGYIASPYGTSAVALNAGGGIGINMATADPTTGTGPLVIRISYIVFSIT